MARALPGEIAIRSYSYQAGDMKHKTLQKATINKEDIHPSDKTSSRVQSGTI